MEQLLSSGPVIERALVTGGCGFVGSRLADALHARGAHVVLYDLTPPLRVLPEGISWVQGDVLDYDNLEKAFTDFGAVTSVFHIAAYGMSGEEQYNDKKVAAVNVQGTCNVIKACLAANVPYLVYTSTVNVVFDGSTDIKDGDEFMLDYCRKKKALGAYSRSKIAAERMVIQMNGAKHDGSAWAASCTYPHWCKEPAVAAKYCSTPSSAVSSSGGIATGQPDPSSPSGSAADTQAVADQAAAGGGSVQPADKKVLGSTSSGSLDAGQHPESRDQGPTQQQPQQQASTPPSSSSPTGDSNGPAAGTGASVSPQQPLPGAPPQTVLHTCALRPSGIWGAGEVRHQLRMVEMLQAGMLMMTIGEPTTLQDWCHVDNLVQAQLLAVTAMGPQTEHLAAGQEYFINDGVAVNTFVFLRPLIEGLGYKYPTMHLESEVALALMRMLEILRKICAPICKIPVPLSCMEVIKATKTHYFNNTKAQRQLGYQPLERDIQEVVEWMVERGYHRKDSQSKGWGHLVGYWLLALVVLLAAAAAAAFLGRS